MNRDQEYDALKYKYDHAQRRVQRLEETVKLLEQQLNEKREQIAVLERVSNVVLWEREKKRLLENCKDQQESLKTDLTQIQEEYTTSKDISRKTIQSLQEQIKKYELMIELELRQSKEDYLKELDKVRQELHVKRTMVARLEKEVTEQQKCFVGILRGLRVDFRILMQKFATDESKSSWKHLSSMFDTVYSSSTTGSLSTLRASLPTHYVGLASDIINSPLPSRKKEMDTSSSCTSLEWFDHNSIAGDGDDTGMEDTDDRGSISSLPILAPSANLTACTTNFIVEAKERIQAHNQHMSQAHTDKTPSEADSQLHASATIPNRLTYKQRSNSLDREGKKDTRHYDALVSPLVKKRAAKAAWRSPKLDSLRSSSFSSYRSTTTTNTSSRNPTNSPLTSKSTTEVKRPNNKSLASKMSQISLSYQETPEEKVAFRKLKTVESYSQPLPRKAKTSPQSTTATTSSDANKVLVDKKNGILKLDDILVNFPHLTEEQARGHFENFMSYDTNNDYTLDFTELMTAVTQVFDQGAISKKELLDVLKEVNTNFSVEFYEYLLLSKKCMDLTGTSDLFHNPMVVQHHKKLSEMCCIQ